MSRRSLLACIVLMGLAAGCGPSEGAIQTATAQTKVADQAAVRTAEPTRTQEPTSTPAPASPSMPEPTNTPEPTDTSEPTNTPEPTNTTRPTNTPQPVEETEGEIAMTIQLTSSAFEHGEAIPRVYTCDGEDLSPELAWTGIPAGAQSLALICDDPDAPVGTWVHWVLYDLAPDLTGLPEGVPGDAEPSPGGIHGKNDFRRLGYGGPCPPKGTPHRYFFKLYALDAKLGLGPGAAKKDVVQAMQGHILARGELMGTYQR